MRKFDAYKLPLKSLSDGVHEFNFRLDDKFFKDIDGPEIHKGSVAVKLSVRRDRDEFLLEFDLSGVAIVPCDRCLDDMESEIEAKEKLAVKFGKDYSDEGEVLIVPETEGELNIAWFLYEFVALEVPMKHVHPAGKCNKKMTTVLRRHGGTHEVEDGEEEIIGREEEDFYVSEETDSRWDELKKLMDNN